MDTHVPAHTRTHTKQCSCYLALFGLFIWIQEKGKGCVYLIVHKREVTQALNLGVCHHHVCVCVCCTVRVNLSFFPSFFGIKLSFLLLHVRKNRHQQEVRGTDNELNPDLPCLTEVAGNRFRLNISYQMTYWTMFLYDSL